MAVTPGIRMAVITRRGLARTGLARSADEGERWMRDAMEYRAGDPIDRPVIGVTPRPGGGFPRLRIRKGTPYHRVDDWLPATGSPDDPRDAAREAVLGRLPAARTARTLIVLRTALVVSLAGPASEAGRPLDGFLRLRAAGEETSIDDVVLVMHVPERLSPWIAVRPADADVERF